MIKCPECGSTDVYFESPFCVWQNSDGSFELDAEEIDWVCGEEIDKTDKRFVCNLCGNIFYPTPEGFKQYTLYVSKIMYGSATVEAQSREDAINEVDNAEIFWHSEEISDVTAEPVED